MSQPRPTSSLTKAGMSVSGGLAGAHGGFFRCCSGAKKKQKAAGGSKGKSAVELDTVMRCQYVLLCLFLICVVVPAEALCL